MRRVRIGLPGRGWRVDLCPEDTHCICSVNPPIERALSEVSALLDERLGQRLHACCVYGSAVRGNAVEGVSDINLLIVLEDFSAAAQQIVAQSLASHGKIDPLVVGRADFARTVRCFASKFASIQRNYRVLRGADPFAGIAIDAGLERLLCEQSLRNLQLRASYAFIMDGRGRNYLAFLAESASAIFVQLSEVLRLSGHELPKDFGARVPVMTQAWAIEGTVLEQLLELREKRQRPPRLDRVELHRRLLAVIEVVLRWMEINWSEQTRGRVP